MGRVYTVGHSTRSVEELLQILRAHGIRRLVDVRRYPGSKRHPHFSRAALQVFLEAQGIEYVHAEALGGRRTPRADSPNISWRSAAFRGYADHLASLEFKDGLERLIGWAPGADTVVMCAEAVPWRCHRQLIADALVARGVEVKNILSETRADAHELNANARVAADGSITYPGSATSEANDQASLFEE
jgi:uncharacterized protein (DUF488 family)